MKTRGATRQCPTSDKARLGLPGQATDRRSRLAFRPMGVLVALTLVLATACGAGPGQGKSAQPDSGSTKVSPDDASSAVGSLASYVGQWYVHGSALTIGSNGSGNMTWNAGPCSQNINVDEGMCTGHASIRFKPVAGRISGTLTKVWYTANTGPLPPDFTQPTQPMASESFTLKMVNADVLYTTRYSNPTMNEGNRNWCRSGYINSQVCGA